MVVLFYICKCTLAGDVSISILQLHIMMLLCLHAHVSHGKTLMYLFLIALDWYTVALTYSGV